MNVYKLNKTLISKFVIHRNFAGKGDALKGIIGTESAHDIEDKRRAGMKFQIQSYAGIKEGTRGGIGRGNGAKIRHAGGAVVGIIAYRRMHGLLV